jgi:DNA-binding NtrC family response regulator
LPCKIVYVDDEIDLCQNFSEYFTSDKVSVETFTSPDLAIEFLNSNTTDFLVVDYRMPGTSGEELALGLSDQIPKILVTADFNVVTTYPFLKILEKPFNLEEIYLAMKSLDLDC